MSDDDFVTPIELFCDGRKLQLRKDQLNVSNLAKLGHISPETLYLISEDNFVALPDKDGKFISLQSFRTWQVEGTPMTSKSPASEQSTSLWNSYECRKYRWKPKPVFRLRSKQTNVPALTTESTIQQVCIDIDIVTCSFYIIPIVAEID